MVSVITNVEYVLIAIGLLLIFAYGIGLIMLAIIAWRIGTRMETSSNEIEECEDLPETNLYRVLEEEEEDLMKSESESTLKQSTESPPLSPKKRNSIFQKTYKVDEYSDIVLENGK